VAWDLMDHLAGRHRIAFIGEAIPDGLPEGVEFLPVRRRRRLPHALAPVEFRRAAAERLRASSPHTSLSLGTVSPVTDVLWVQSVHRAWLRVARGVPVGPAVAPGRLRYAMPRHLALLAIERAYFRHPPRTIICTSLREVTDLADLYDVDPTTATVIPNPYDPQLFNFERRTIDRGAARLRMGASAGEIALLFVANELHRKGFAQLLSALAIAADDRLTVHVIGRTAPSGYRRMIQRLGLEGRVRYHGPTNDVGWWLAGADLLVLPTQYEPFGLVIIEALASGVPVITTRLAGAAEAVQNGATGLLQNDPADPSELAGLIERATSADLEEWGRIAAGSVGEYRRDRVLARVERILFDARQAP
jgi:UDP-glucose:(heptosyl)LPS alpha-1,3-glucosyltransferase